MKKRIICNLISILAACVLCCACGEKGGTIVIGGTQENGTKENRTQESGAEGTESESGGAGGQEPVKNAEKEASIQVYVCGAVANPGVVELPAGSRVEQALLAAGGFGPEAAREAVNLADWVSDGQMVYFPTQGEAAESKLQQEEAADGLVNINTADIAMLCTLPGIGESRAADIIAYREANGSFESCEDIMKVSGIKTAMYEKIKDKIKVK